MSPKKLGKGFVLHRQSREIVNNVSNFMKNEAENGLSIPLKNHRQRILAATGVSKSTFQKISTEAMKIQWQGPGASFQTPKKSGPRKKRKLGLVTPSQIKTIRDIVYEFYLVEKRHPTLKGIWQKVHDRGVLSEQVCVTSLSRLLRGIGFRWQKMQEKRSVLCESYDIRTKRIKFLKKISDYRNEGRKVIYTNETYIHTNHVQENGCYGASNKDINEGSKKPISKAQRLTILHAGGENGFVKNGLLILKSGRKTGDNEMNHTNLMNWVEKQLLPNLAEKSVLVIDNAAYHNVPVRKNITTVSTKAEMLEWLEEKGLPADQNLTKTELYDMILENKCRFRTQYKLDKLLELHGHCVLRIPPYHRELNPIEKIWVLVKNWVEAQNTTLEVTDIESLTRQKIDDVTEEVWFNICQHVRKYEDLLLRNEHLLDEALETLEFNANTGSSEENEDSSDEDEASNDE